MYLGQTKLLRIFFTLSIIFSLYFFIINKASASPSSQLESYQEKIKPQMLIYRQNVQSNSNLLFKEFKNLTPKQILEDFELYYPIYYAAFEKYQVPFYLLWIIHIQETTVSRSTSADNELYKGAMQRSRSSYSNSYVEEAASGWEFLTNQKQRYRKDKGEETNDFEEILFAAKKISEDASIIQKFDPNLSWEDALLQAQYRYCAKVTAQARINQFKIVKKILGKVNYSR